MIFAQSEPHFHKVSTPMALKCKIIVKETYLQKYIQTVKIDENTSTPKNAILESNFRILSLLTPITEYMKPKCKI